MFLENCILQDAEENTHRTVKGKLSDRSARTPRKWTSDQSCAESEDIQHVSIGHDSGGVIMILLQNSLPEGGIFCFRLKTMSVTAYMMLVPPSSF